MTALTKAGKTHQYAVGKYNPQRFELGMANGAQIWAGGIVAMNSSGYIKAATKQTTLTDQIIGVSEESVLNSGANGAVRCRILRGVFLMNNASGGDALANTDFGIDAYAEDDNVVAKNRATSTGSTQQVITVTPTTANDTLFALLLRWHWGDSLWREALVTYLSDGASNATEQCNGLRTRMTAMDELTGVITGTGTSTLVLTGAHGLAFEAHQAGPGILTPAATTAGVYTNIRRPKVGKFWGLDQETSLPLVQVG